MSSQIIVSHGIYLTDEERLGSFKNRVCYSGVLNRPVTSSKNLEKYFLVGGETFVNVQKIDEDRRPDRDDAYTHTFLSEYNQTNYSVRTWGPTGYYLQPQRGDLIVSASVIGCLRSTLTHVMCLTGRTRELTLHHSYRGTPGAKNFAKRCAVLSAVALRDALRQKGSIGKVIANLQKPWIYQKLSNTCSALLAILSPEGEHNSRRLITVRRKTLEFEVVMAVSFISSSDNPGSAACGLDQLRIRIMLRCLKCQLTKKPSKCCGTLSQPITYGLIPA